MAKYYVYTLAKPDGTIFYVGKGSGYRIAAHESAARRGDDSHRSRVIRKVWAEGGQVIRAKVLETDDEHEAFAYEEELTHAIGLAYLTNAVEGGGGITGWRHSEETLALLSKAHTGIKHTPESAAKISQALQNYFREHPRTFSEETRHKLAEAARRRLWTPEIHEAHSEGLREAWRTGRFHGMIGQAHTDEARAKIAAGLRGRERSETTRRKGSEARRQWWNQHRAPADQLTWEKVRELRRLRAEGWTYKALGERYGMTASSAYLIAANKTWREDDAPIQDDRSE